MKFITKIIVVLVLIFAIYAKPKMGKAQAVPTPILEAEKIKSDTMDYILKGYNIAYGNPHDEQVDQGFRRKIFMTTFTNGDKTLDGYNIPDGTLYSTISSCSGKMSTSSILGAKSYQDSLKVDVSAEGSIGPFAFSASAGFKQVEEETKENKNEYREDKADCEVYQMELNTISPPQLSKDFLKALSSLPLPYEKKHAAVYHTKFLNIFGTHCFSWIKMGSRFGRLRKFSSKSGSRSNSNTVSAGAKASAFGIGGGVNVEKGRTDSSKNENTDESVSSFSIGGIPTDSYQEWLTQQKTAALPISYNVMSMGECLELDAVKDQLPADKRDRMISSIKNAVTSYCDHYLKPTIVKECLAKDPVKKKVVIIKLEEGNSAYSLINAKTGMCVSYLQQDRLLEMTDCNAKNVKQFWKIEVNRNFGGYYIHPKDNGGISWEVRDESDDENAVLQIKGHRWGYRGQFFDLDLDSEGNYKFINKKSRKCVQPASGNNLKGTNLVQMICNDNELSQKWNVFQKQKK